MTQSKMRIFRYRLDITDEQTLDLPANAEVLSVGPPRDGLDQLDMWALVDVTATKELRTFQIFGTGHPMSATYSRFIGTVPTHEGMFVWHVFEKLADRR